ncbi:AraC family transcriptional activator of mar-sox-rob regulon [Rhodoblastus acidophilus]|uniref:AraC family transcriptional regulator n=1 Tax=Rhodoblastus acidophilus TaxID=1074 RepID=UPI002224F349|nr:AraC family transcriptional regulator [Rhodoblastus acidophilus]MCW2318565.1 AraC family transcriptional activator of mar-sox-rob regulon [Rhodoblastus acidophilus]
MLWTMKAELAESTEWHAHAVVEIILCLGNGGCLDTGTTTFEFSTDRTILVPPGVNHRYIAMPNTLVTLKLACLTREDTSTNIAPAQAALLANLCAEGVTAADHHGETIGVLAELMPDGLISVGACHTQQIGFSALGLLISLHAKARGVILDETSGERHGDRIRDVTAWIDKHLMTTFNLQDLASRFGMSRALLTREFRRHTGASVVGYTTMKRLEQAAMTLATGDADVTAAAYASGFANLSHFHRRFKAAYGLTPAAFRRKIMEESAL